MAGTLIPFEWGNELDGLWELGCSVNLSKFVRRRQFGWAVQVSEFYDDGDSFGKRILFHGYVTCVFWLLSTSCRSLCCLSTCFFRLWI